MNDEMGWMGELRTLAERVGTRDWRAEDHREPEGWWVVSGGPLSGPLHPAVCPDEATAQFIAAVDPPMVIAILDHVSYLRRQVRLGHELARRVGELPESDRDEAFAAAIKEVNRVAAALRSIPSRC